MNGLRPSHLKPGDQITCGDRIYTFIKREDIPGIGFRCTFQCDDFRGLDGPADNGECWMTDARVIRRCQRVQRINTAQRLAA